MKLTPEELRTFLVEKAEQYAVRSFIADDPVQIPHEFEKVIDIEISGLIASIFSWGQRKTIIAKSRNFLDRMDWAPSDFVLRGTEEDWSSLEGFTHRTFNSEDALGLVRSLKALYESYPTLGDFFAAHIDPNAGHVGGAFTALKAFLLDNGLPARAGKHFGDPESGSACKRLVMYTRWMVRTGAEGIDFGLWTDRISPSLLSLPLDVHSGRVARTLGLLGRKQNDWKAVRELDEALRKLAPEDPAKLDYALFGLGVYEGWT